MKNFLRRIQPTKKNPIPKKSTLEMREFLKKHDPKFATDLYLDNLSFDELVEYYQDCVDSLDPRYRDDWCERLERVRTNNM